MENLDIPAASEQSSVRSGGRDRKLSAHVRQQEALSLRAAGQSYEQIADALGFASRSGAHKSVASAMKRFEHGAVEELRALHAEVLREIRASLWDKRKDPATARAILACLERESRLYGLDQDGGLTQRARDDLIEGIVKTIREFIRDDEGRQQFAERLRARVR